MKKRSGFAIMEIILVVALVGVIVAAIYLALNKPSLPASNPVAVEKPAQGAESATEIKSTKDIDKAIEENEVDSTADMDSEMSQIDQDLKEL